MVKTASAAEGEKEPLDPSVERVRRKLVRFVAINLGLLFIALMAVLAAIVYKSGWGSSQTPVAETAAVPSSAEEAFVEADIVLPAGAKMLTHSLSAGRISMDVELADGNRAIFIYDIAARRMIGRLAIRAE
ncbi:fimbrial protein [Pseudaminobacter sp. NGMCC 1.201702]|uniref:fimbrial protein n=1 Tax=Pseudaminobacter sp. NGMCC 1.201702 TaxID=3391825 RepID=UPI0039F1410A